MADETVIEHDVWAARKLMQTLAVLSSMLCPCEPEPKVRLGALVIEHNDDCPWLNTIAEST